MHLRSSRESGTRSSRTGRTLRSAESGFPIRSHNTAAVEHSGDLLHHSEASIGDGNSYFRLQAQETVVNGASSTIRKSTIWWGKVAAMSICRVLL